MLDTEYLKRVMHYFESGDCKFEFEHGEEERRLEIIDFLEHLMELGEKADELATKLIFKDAYASMITEDGVAKAKEEEAAREDGE